MSTEHIGGLYDDIQAIQEQGKIVEAVSETAEQQVSVIFEKHGNQLARFDKLYVTGCGDSYYAALAVEWHLETLLKKPVRAIEALDFSRYYVDTAANHDLVIAISNSGAVARTVEAIRVAKKRGLTTIAITGNLESDLAQHAHIVINQKVDATNLSIAPQLSKVLGLGNYLASLTTLLVFSYRFAHYLGELNEAMLATHRGDLKATAAIIHDTYHYNHDAIHSWVSQLRDRKEFFILGGGPNYATALFAAAKFFEQPRLSAAAVQLEEWAHEQFFLVGEGTPVFVIAPEGRSADRAYELMLGIKEMGGVLLVTGPTSDKRLQGVADAYFPVPGSIPEHLSPLPYCIPHQLFAALLGAALNRTYTSFSSPKQKEVNFRLIFNSQQKVPE